MATILYQHRRDNFFGKFQPLNPPNVKRRACRRCHVEKYTHHDVNLQLFGLKTLEPRYLMQ